MGNLPPLIWWWAELFPCSCRWRHRGLPCTLFPMTDNTKTSSVVLFYMVSYNNWHSQNATSSSYIVCLSTHLFLPPNLTFFWQVCPRGFNSLFTASILLRTCATSFLIGSASASSSWRSRKFRFMNQNKQQNPIQYQHIIISSSTTCSST